MRKKYMFIALVLTFFVPGLGSIYAGNYDKGKILVPVGIILFSLRIMGIFPMLWVLFWAFSFYEAYRDVEIANGNPEPRIYRDWGKWSTGRRVALIAIVILIVVVSIIGPLGLMLIDSFHPEYSDTGYYSSSSSGVSHSHYGGVDTSPHTIARDNPDWFYDYYDYGDYDDIDEYLESEGYG